MRKLSFKDSRGQRGQITESLEVEYTGEWEEEVSQGLRHIAPESNPGDCPRDNEQVFNQIVLELPKKAPIIEVERTDDPVTPDPGER